MDFRILGPLEVTDQGREPAIAASKQRALLAILLLHANEVVSSDRLIEGLWGERPPASASKSLQVYISRLRHALERAQGNGADSVIVTRGGGYLIRVGPGELDLDRFERLLEEGSGALADGEPAQALDRLRDALALWRGPPLAEFAYEPFAQREIARFEDLHLTATEELVDAKLALGRHAEVVTQVEGLIADHPYRERLRAQLMLALYRSGRQAEALQAYHDARTKLVEELGIEPGERLRELERAILAQDAALATPAAVPTTGDERGASSPPAELPTGVVTFLLTDIEGSSGLWEADADAMAAALELHDELIACTVDARGGRLLKVKGEGDATLTVFRRASDAVACAVELRRALHGAAWPGGLDLRVRVALHTGEAHEREGDYFGRALNRAARLRGLVRGGATVMSQATAEIVQDRLPPDVELLELGRQELRGLSRPENVFELRAISEAVLAGESALDAPRTIAAGGPDALGRPPAPPTRTIDADVAAPEAEAPTTPTAARTAPPERRRARLLAPAVMLLGACGIAALALILLVGHDVSSKPPLTDDSHAVAVIDPSTNRVDEALSVGTRPGSLAFDRESGSLWVANVDDETVTHIDPGRRRVGRTVPVGGAPTGLAAGGGALWVTSSKPGAARVTVQEINASFDTVERTERVGDYSGERPRVALGKGTLWVAPQFGLLTRVNPRTGSVLRPTIDSGHYQDAVAAGDDSVWVAGGSANTVTRIDAVSGATTPTPVGNGPADIALGSGAVWVTLGLENSVARIDPETGAVDGKTPVGRSPAGVAVGAGSVWVANSGDGTVTRIDPHSGDAVATIAVGGSPQDVAVAAGGVWVSVRPRTLPASRPIGTLRVEVASRLTTMDPGVAIGVSDWQLSYPVGARLLNYPDAPAPAGSELQPEVATSLPSRSEGGRTYTFTLRKGFRFSPPSGEPVTAATFKFSIERALSPKMKGFAGNFVSDIVGAGEYMEGKAAHIAGITARGDELRIRLVRPAGDFPTRIAMPFFSAVPTDTPIDPQLGRVPASAGPYYVASFDEDEGALLKRNPNYHGGRPGRPRQIRYSFGVKRRQGLADVESGSADYAPVTEFGDKPSQAAALARRYGPGSGAAEAGRQRYFINPTQSVDYIALNTSRPLFSSPRMRRAVNYAVDRRALERQGGLNLPFPLLPTDQYLPPGFPGFDDSRIYPFRPNLEKARRLAGGRRRTAVFYAYNEPPSARVAQVVKNNLEAIGIDVDVRLFARGVFFKRLSNKNEPYDMAMVGWFADNVDPANFLNQLDGRAFDEGSPLSSFVNLARFDDPTFNRRLVAAEKLSGPRRYIAYSRLEQDMVRDAPWMAFGTETSHDFFSARTGCQVYQPIYGIDLGALCIDKHAR